MALKEKKLRFWPLEKENINITYGKKKKKECGRKHEPRSIELGWFVRLQ